MKKLLSLCLVAILLVTMLPVNVFASEPNTETKTLELKISATQPRLTGEKYVALGSVWTEIDRDDNYLDEYVTVTNDGLSVKSVMIRITNINNITYKGPVTIAPGESKILGPIPSNFGTYIIQGKSADGEDTNYYLYYHD